MTSPERMNPDSMKSTWPKWDRKNWNYTHWLVHALDVYPLLPDKPAPVFPKDAKVPHLSQASQQLWIITFAWIAYAIHQLYHTFIGPMHPIGVTLLYTWIYMFVLVHEVKMIRKLGYKTGYLDGDTHVRDGIPDVGVGRVFGSLVKTVGGRVGLFAYLCYDKNVSPLEVFMDPKWLAATYFKIGVYGIVLDGWFYLYHRCMHDINPLWKFHRTHHLTKHPNATLTAYAGDTQEVFDMVGIPFLTYITMQALGFNLGFYDWFMSQQFIVFTEVMGHSGLRVHLTATSTLHWALGLFDLELALEDHDIHHRKGYRKSFNYGKQTRVWDTLFGTTTKRIESYDDNIDYENQVSLPLF